MYAITKIEIHEVSEDYRNFSPFPFCRDDYQSRNIQETVYPPTDH